MLRVTESTRKNVRGVPIRDPAVCVCVCVCVCVRGGDTEDKRTFELQIIMRNETISDQKSCSVCVCVCVCEGGGGGTPRTNVRLICRLSREIKPYPIRKRADRRRKHNKQHVMKQHKSIWTRSSRERLLLVFSII